MSPKRLPDAATSSGELSPHAQFDLEVLLDQVVSEVVRHEVVVTGSEPREQSGPNSR